ncbi:MAG: GspH/FimT family protein [Wenzhouxiangella sp.]|nr:GspH/FimT family protein [Wenzhouxiangella sp.]
MTRTYGKAMRCSVFSESSGAAPLGSGRPDCQAGFTLIELMVVMMLVMMLLAVVGVSVSRSVEGAERRAVEREITAGLRHTRGQAIIQRAQQVFTVDSERRTWQAAGRDPVELPEGLEITMNTARSELTGEGIGGIRFYPDGASTGGSIVLHAQEREWHIAVAWLTGEISRDREREEEQNG